MKKYVNKYYTVSEFEKTFNSIFIVAEEKINDNLLTVVDIEIFYSQAERKNLYIKIGDIS